MSAEQTAALLMALREEIAPVLEAVDGYKASAIERGYTSKTAEQMTIDYHRHLLALVFRTTN